jgi:hypothetical protein
MNKKNVSIILFFFILISCSNKENEDKTQSEKYEVLKDDKIVKLEQEASRLRAGSTIKSVELNGKIAKISYVNNYEEYKKINPQSELTELDFKDYWESGEAVEKTLVDGSVRIMKKLDYIDEVTIVLPIEGITHTIKVNKKDLEKFIKADFSTIISNWDKLFSKPYVYDDKGRKLFINKFSK